MNVRHACTKNRDQLMLIQMLFIKFLASKFFVPSLNKHDFRWYCQMENGL